jgi:uncharacterized protein YyaL (SSP411 family)
MTISTAKHTNLLAQESSPYLLQHAHNPVNWQGWNDTAWAEAKEKNKLVLISIGYSACHWCHVMEHESFEDEQVAKIMNEHFICIKVDREERPDVDQVYMMAVQLMTGQGGWPLNCFATPDGRPVYGGTYFQKAQWMNILLNLADVWKTEPDKVYEYAEKLTEGVQKAELISVKNTEGDPEPDTLINSWVNWSKRVDNQEGGPNKAPKFPLPNNYLFLLHLGQSELLPPEEAKKLNSHLALTLKKMAFGGIYDQIGGGFSRYATDRLWKIPHFEKMLYDNAQLISLYAEGYRLTKDPLYKQIVFETIDFSTRELCSAEGIFYSALDADSEGEEGKFYVWEKEELKTVLGSDFQIFAAFYNINDIGLWEHGNYILLRKSEASVISSQFNIPEEELEQKIRSWKSQLLQIREKRIRPGLDDKSLCSWNALMITACTDAYIVFNETRFLDTAITCAKGLLLKLRRTDGGLYHSYKNGKATVNGFLEDYCFLIEACIGLYESTFNESWLKTAEELCNYVMEHFKDPQSAFFFFTSYLDPALIARKFELSDNVIPASNSSFAKCLFLLGHFLERQDYTALARKMLLHLQAEITQYGAGYSNWGILQLWLNRPFYEVVIVGKDVDEKHQELRQHYLPNLIFAGSKGTSDWPLIRNKYKEGQTLIYVCWNHTCLAPVTEVSEVLQLLHRKV